MIPKEIESKHILEALKELDRDGVLPNREATKYALEYHGKKYPPKEVLRVAARYATGEEHLYGSSGGEMTNEFIQKRGFTVREISVWSKKDCYFAVWAYDQLDIDSSAPKRKLIAEVARILVRSANSVNWKIQEVASLDPRPDNEKPVAGTREPQAPLVEVFNWYWKDRSFARSIYDYANEPGALGTEFPYFEPVKDQPVLLVESTRLRGETTSAQVQVDLERIESDLKRFDGPTEKEALVKVRIQQGRFREGLQKLWNDRCAVSDTENPKLLLASHIKPWSCCNDIEKLDPSNGLLLSPLLDRLFDQGLITFNETGSILYSSELVGSDRNKLGLNAGLKLRKKLTDETEMYMKYHREHVFKSDPLA